MTKPFAMIIEDDRDIVALFRHVLDVAGFITDIVLRGELAIQRLDTITPDIVLLDLNLTGVPGSEILKKIRTDDRLKDIPVIVITGYANLAVGLEAETDLILHKPVSMEQLTSLINRLCPGGTKPHSDPPYDPLTRLYNRSFFISRLGYTIERIGRLASGLFGVLLIDYDGFSRVEQQEGKKVANDLLIETARFLRTVIRPYDTVSRFNSDRFCIQIEDLPDKEVLLKIAGRIQKNLSGRIQETCGIQMTASIGVVYCGPDYLRADDILRDADIALHAAKITPSADLVIFDPARHAGYRCPEDYAPLVRVGTLFEDYTSRQTNINSSEDIEPVDS